MSHTRKQSTTLAAMGLLVGASLACALPGASAPTPTPTPPPATATPPPSPTPVPPTPTPAVDEVIYEDPPGDCLSNDNAPAPCDPEGLDILTVTITRGSDISIMIELAGPVLADLPFFGVIHGIDLDSNPTTGNTGFWPEFHGIAPDLEVHYFSENGTVQMGVTQYMPDGTPTELDASLAAWTLPDDSHVQVIISEELFPQESFSIAGDIFVDLVYDHFVDEGHLLFPAGDAILNE